MIEKIIDYFKNRITLTEDYKEILADFLGENATSYSIETIPTEIILKQYTDGSSLRQLVFQLASREHYDESENQNVRNLEFYEKLQKEIEDNNKNGVLPEITGIQSIECLNYASIQNVETGSAKYVIQMRIVYLYEDKKEISQ